MDEREKKRLYNSAAWKRTRLAVLARDGYVCQIKTHRCTEVATAADHIVPLEKGGAPLSPSNLRAACKNCNSAMAARGNDDGPPGPSRNW